MSNPDILNIPHIWWHQLLQSSKLAKDYLHQSGSCLLWVVAATHHFATMKCLVLWAAPLVSIQSAIVIDSKIASLHQQKLILFFIIPLQQETDLLHGIILLIQQGKMKGNISVWVWGIKISLQNIAKYGERQKMEGKKKKKNLSFYKRKKNRSVVILFSCRQISYFGKHSWLYVIFLWWK